MQTPPSSFECVPLRGMVAEDGISNHNFPEQSPLSDVPDTEAVRVATSRWSDGMSRLSSSSDSSCSEYGGAETDFGESIDPDIFRGFLNESGWSTNMGCPLWNSRPWMEGHRHQPPCIFGTLTELRVQGLPILDSEVFLSRRPSNILDDMNELLVPAKLLLAGNGRASSNPALQVMICWACRFPDIEVDEELIRRGPGCRSWTEAFQIAANDSDDPFRRPLTVWIRPRDFQKMNYAASQLDTVVFSDAQAYEMIMQVQSCHSHLVADILQTRDERCATCYKSMVLPLFICDELEICREFRVLEARVAEQRLLSENVVYRRKEAMSAAGTTAASSHSSQGEYGPDQVYNPTDFGLSYNPSNYIIRSCDNLSEKPTHQQQSWKSNGLSPRRNSADIEYTASQLRTRKWNKNRKRGLISDTSLYTNRRSQTLVQ